MKNQIKREKNKNRKKKEKKHKQTRSLSASNAEKKFWASCPHHHHKPSLLSLKFGEGDIRTHQAYQRRRNEISFSPDGAFWYFICTTHKYTIPLYISLYPVSGFCVLFFVSIRWWLSSFWARSWIHRSWVMVEFGIHFFWDYLMVRLDLIIFEYWLYCWYFLCSWEEWCWSNQD